MVQNMKPHEYPYPELLLDSNEACNYSPYSCNNTSDWFFPEGPGFYTLCDKCRLYMETLHKKSIPILPNPWSLK